MSAAHDFRAVFARYVFPADTQRADVEVLCKVMFDAGRRSLRNELRRRDKAIGNQRRKAAKGSTP